MTGGRYEFGVGRGHGWIPWRAGLPYSEMVERYDESLEILFKALESGGEPIDHEGKYFQIHDARVVPPPSGRSTASSPAAPPTRPTSSRRRRAGAWSSRRSSRTRRCASSSTSTARSAPSSGTTPDIVWIHACYLDEDRDTAIREAEAGIKGFLAGNASPLVEHTKPPAEELQAAGYGFYTAGILEGLAQTPYDEMIANDIVWVGTPQDVIERIEAVRERLRGSDGDLDHRQPGRLRPLDGDQEPGALRQARDAALQVAGTDTGCPPLLERRLAVAAGLGECSGLVG